VAGVNYEVNIQLNAKKLDDQLKTLEKRVNDLKKNLAAPLRNEDAAARRSLTTQKQSARLAERRQATQIVTYNLGRKTNELEAKGVNVAKIREKLSAAAKENDKGRLTMARAQNSVARTLIAQETAKLRISTKANRMQAESIDALFKAQVKRYTLDQQIRRLEEAGVKTDKLRAKLGEITAAQAKRNFGTHKQLSAQLTLDIKKERDKLALQQRQTRELQKQLKLSAANAPFNPIQGSASLPGSPIARQLARRGDPRAYTTPVGPFPAFSGVAPSSPIGGAPNIPGSPAGLRRQRRIQQASGVALGAGFPLLFGGGPGSVLGGAAGGLVGGPAGFAAQIALSALGQQLDKFVGSTLEASKAFTSTSKAFEFVREKSLFSSQQIEARAIELEKQGKAEELAKLLTQELTTVIGTDGVKSLKLLGDETSEVTRLWAQLTLQLQALIAGPLTNFLKLVSQFVGGITLRSQFSALEQSVSPTQAKRLQEILTEKRGTRVISAQQQAAAFSDPRFQTAPITQSRAKQITVPGTITNEVLRQTLEQATKEGIKAPATPLIPVTPLDRLGITPPKTKKGRRSRIPDLQAEQQKLQQLLGLERTMFELKRNDDDLGVRQLEHRMRMAELAEKEAKIRASDVPQKEKDLAISNLGLEAKRAELQLAYDIEQINKEAAQRAFEEMQNKIKQQNQLNKGMQQQLQLAQQVSDVLGQGMTRSFDLLITGASNWGMALRDIAANVLQDIARQLIQIYVIEQAVGFMRTLFSPNPYASLVAPGGRYEGGALPSTPPPLPALPGKALGGAVSAGKPYMVGERGPELFVPGAQGNIVPNHGMGGSNIVVNVDASGSSVEGNANEQKQLGEAIGVAIRQELIKQKRPGGLLA
jgi:hypothetical protein